VDPGSKSFDLYALETLDGAGEVILDTSIPTNRIKASPQELIDAVASVEPFDYMVAPSGFGLPLKPVRDITDADLRLILLKKNAGESVVGLTQILGLLQQRPWNAWIIPGVKHLPTIPTFRKINRIDLGTADKVCVAALGVRDQMETHAILPTQVNAIIVEIGYAFSAVMAVQSGQIIDGIGGSNLLGFRAAGALDGELAYLMGHVKKGAIYKGGVSSIAGFEDLTVEELLLLARRDERVANALLAFYEGIVKAVASLSSEYSPHSPIREVLVSGRHLPSEMLDMLHDHLTGIAPVRLMKTYATVSKRAAQGAAVIADGLMGGKYAPIVDRLQIREAAGSILDHIYLPLTGEAGEE
jgi:predicted butyrate kinase (DUF1464 family)